MLSYDVFGTFITSILIDRHRGRQKSFLWDTYSKKIPFIILTFILRWHPIVGVGQTIGDGGSRLVW